MVSPTSSGIQSETSTPSITITDDHGHGETLKLPDAIIADRPRSIAFDISGVKDSSDVVAITRPNPPRVMSSEVTGTAGTVATSGLAATTDTPSSKKKPDLKRTGSGNKLNFTNLKQQASNANLFRSHKAAGPKSTLSSGTSSPATHTPEVQSLFQNRNKICPDLDAVNRALESLRTASAGENDQFVCNLTQLAKQIKQSQADSKKALSDAMRERDIGHSEICRALCISIVQNKNAELDTKVYAYNILSTQASPGQATNYLTAAYDLVKENEAKGGAAQALDCEKMLEVIAVLKEGALADEDSRAVTAKKKMKKTSKLLNSKELEQKLRAIPLDSGLRRDSVTPKDLLNVPKGDLPSGMLTPKTERILTWAAREQV